MESSEIKNILSKYLTVEKNVDIFSKHITRVDDEFLEQILYEILYQRILLNQTPYQIFHLRMAFLLLFHFAYYINNTKWLGKLLF